MQRDSTNKRERHTLRALDQGHGCQPGHALESVFLSVQWVHPLPSCAAVALFRCSRCGRCALKNVSPVLGGTSYVIA